MSRHGISPAFAVCSTLLTMQAAGARAAAAESGSLPPVVVIGTTPVPGMAIDVDKVPGTVQSLSAGDLRQDGTSSLSGGLSARLGSVNVNDTLADPFQPDILYRGFEASPVLGTPQGLAVYQNGVRINESFGDTVNWDLFPDIAVSRVDIVSSNPLFGLNALGGAVSVTLKNGFSLQGTNAELAGGSFNQRQGAAEFGGNNDTLGFYAAARVSNQNGWRYFSRDSVHQYYFDWSLRADAATIDLSYARANNRLFGQGAAPVQSLALDRRNVFTGPQTNTDDLDFITINGAFPITASVALQNVLYSRTYRQTVANGNHSNYVACSTDGGAGELCQGDATTPLADATGGPITDISNGGRSDIGENNFERIRSEGWGGSLQLTSTRAFGTHGNRFAAAVTFDTAETNFYSGTEVGVVNGSLTVLPSGLFVSTPEGTAFSATPLNLNANNKYYGAYLTDTFDVTEALSVTASARYNIAKLNLADQLGTALSGNNRFTHLNPALGAAYQWAPAVTAYAGYSTNNRAPTASEIECSDPARPCLLPSNLAGDPPNLKQVIAHTVELGVRGRWSTPSSSSRLTGNASVFRTNLANDIYGIATTISTGFFQNIGSTRRQGFESGLTYQAAQWSAYAQYSYIDATFRSPLLLHSASNPLRDADGNIHVMPGDDLPLVPHSRVKLGVDYAFAPHWSCGTSLNLASAAYYRGDESNRNPQLSGYHVVSLRLSYRFARQLEIFANMQNVFDERYSTFGLFGDPTAVGAPGIPIHADSNDPRVDNRFQSPAMPRAYFGGVRLSF